MPIKGSDDYITARAANPWTGQISPSVAGTPHTPDTPGEALRIRKTRESPGRQHGSPSARTKQGEALRLANEGRKMDGLKVPGKSDVGFWRKYLMSNDTDMVPSAAGSNVMHASIPMKNEDRFVVKMPCAQEPQPYAHPGRSSQQIQAFEHYKHKTRRTSGEGYDRRLVQQCGPANVRIASAESIPEESLRPVDSRNTSNTISELSSGTVTTKIDRIARKPVAKLEAAAPLHLSQATSVERPLESPSRYAALNRQTSDETGIDTIPPTIAAGRAPLDQHSGVMHLNQLPRVKIVHPSLAALPSTKPSIAQEPRSCSLGCRGGMCAPKKSADADNTTQGVLGELPSSRQTSAAKPVDLAQISTQSFDLVTSSVMLAWYSMPTISLMEKQIISLKQCYSKDATVWQLFLAAKDLLALLIQCILIVVVLGCLWIVIAIIARALQIIFWPVGMVLHVSRMLVRL